METAMQSVKKKVKKMAFSFLQSAGVPERELAERTKSVGQYFLLGGVFLIVPLLLWELPPVVTIVIQLGYAIMMVIGVLLGFDDKN